MSARDEFPLTPTAVHRGGVLSEVAVHAADYEAMCDRIDTLTAENAELEQSIANGDSFEATIVAQRDEARGELRSLRAVVAEAKRKWELDTADSAIKYLLRLTALVPSDGSWETEQ